MFLPSLEDNRVRAVFSASLENIDRFCGEVRRILKMQKLDKYLFDIELLVREALNNAVLHGSKADAKKLVKCMIKISEDCIVIDVTDEGEGFDWHGQMENTEDRLSPSGRGMDIMKTYAAEVTFSEKGNRLVLMKKRSERGRL